MSTSVVAVKPETLLVPLPAKPDWFDRELEQVATKGEKPMFRIVDGQREMKWRNGKMDIKHLLQHESVPAYLPVVRQVFRRMDTATWKPKYYSSLESAEVDPQVSLEKEVTWANIVSTRGVGRACWVVEAYVSPDEIGYENWEAGRWAELQVHGVYQKVDVLGPFPREGMYMYCFSVVGEDGQAIAPNRQTIEECKKRWKAFTDREDKSLQQEISDYDDREKKFEELEVKRISDSFYQFHGIAARRAHEGVVSRPIQKVYE